MNVPDALLPGKLCIEVGSSSKIAFISEELCIGCGICVKVWSSSVMMYPLRYVSVPLHVCGRVWSDALVKSEPRCGAEPHHICVKVRCLVMHATRSNRRLEIGKVHYLPQFYGLLAIKSVHEASRPHRMRVIIFE